MNEYFSYGNLPTLKIKSKDLPYVLLTYTETTNFPEILDFEGLVKVVILSFFLAFGDFEQLIRVLFFPINQN